jgi:hypothetical protein
MSCSSSFRLINRIALCVNEALLQDSEMEGEQNGITITPICLSLTVLVKLLSFSEEE